MNRPSWYSTNLVVRFHEIFFSLNIAFALAVPWLILALPFHDGETGSADSYVFLSAATRFGSFLPGGASNGGAAEIVFAVTLMSCAVLLFMVLRAVEGTSLRGVLLNEFAGLTAVFSVPVGLLYAVKATWSREHTSFWSDVGVKCFVAELIFCILLLLLRRRRRFSLWAFGFLLLLHFAAWGFLLWSRVSDLIVLASYSQSSTFVHKLIGPVFFAAVFPLSGLAWVLYLGQGEEGVKPGSRLGSKRAALGGSLFAAALLLMIWWPVKGHSVVHSGNVKSLKVTMERTHCRGSCPIYSVTVTGDGAVDYNGIQYVAKKGHQTATLTPEQIAAVADGLDRINFFALEDRVFLWCFDTPRVNVSVSIDGKEKTVSSDSYCPETNAGPQAQFVQFAEQLDKLVETEKWIDCAGRCRQ